MTEDPATGTGHRASNAVLLDALVRDAYHASLAMHAALAAANDSRTCDHILSAIESVEDVVEGARRFALEASDRAKAE